MQTGRSRWFFQWEDPGPAAEANGFFNGNTRASGEYLGPAGEADGFFNGNTLGQRENVTIKIKDCDSDDPQNPCLDFPSYLIVDGGNDELKPVTFEDKNEKVIELQENSIQFSEAFKPEMDYSYSIYNISGQAVTEGSLNELQGQLDLPQTGFYIIHIFSKEKKLIQTEKLIYIKN